MMPSLPWWIELVVSNCGQPREMGNTNFLAVDTSLIGLDTEVFLSANVDTLFVKVLDTFS